MVRHVILWQLKEEFTAAQKTAICAGIKTGLESLKGKIPGLLEIQVHVGGLASSTADAMLETRFADAESLRNYAKHPAHVAVADGKVRPFVKTRLCLDFEE